MRNLRKLRYEKNLTQTALQTKLGIDQAIISKYENGDRYPTIENLILLADFFKTSLDFLMDRTDEIRPYPLKRNPKED